MTSFRLRLAVLVGVVTAALLVGGGFLAWGLTTRFNLDRLDRELGRLARSNLDRVNDSSHWARLDSAFALMSGGDRKPAYALWVENHGRQEYRSPGWPADIAPERLHVASADEGMVVTPPPPPPKKMGLSPRNPALPVKPVRLITLTAHGSAWRLAITGNPYTKLVLAANLDELNLDLQRLRGRMLALLPVVLLLVGAAAWWLGTRALRPLATLTRAAENITAQGLDQRIAAPAHDREFQRLVSVFNAMLDRLEHGFHQARRFSADASHELKTPLALLQMELEHALLTAPPDSPQQAVYSSLLEEIQRLKTILEKLLLLTLADSGRLELQRAPIDLGKVVSAIVEDCVALAPALRLDCAIAPNVIVVADAVLLEQALQNLLNNAVKYNRPGGRIRVELRSDAGRPTVVVGNTGPGIAPADRPRIFERFYRADTARSRDRSAGVGLGLSLSREILRAHGGELLLAAADPDWTEFVASIPEVPPASSSDGS